jgi:hypothetical protein
VPLHDRDLPAEPPNVCSGMTNQVLTACRNGTMSRAVDGEASMPVSFGFDISTAL